MSECREVADTMRAAWNGIAVAGKAPGADLPPSAVMEMARTFVRAKMPGESVTVVDNVAWALVAP